MIGLEEEMTYREAGHGAAYAVLRAPLSVCLTRARARADGPLAEAGVIESLRHQFADLGAFEEHAIEAGRSAPTRSPGWSPNG